MVLSSLVQESRLLARHLSDKASIMAALYANTRETREIHGDLMDDGDMTVVMKSRR